MDHFANTSLYMLPFVAFAAGIMGSIHCVAMCGAIATSCSGQLSQNIFYQVGRLISYSILGLLAGLLGHGFSQLTSNPYIKVLPAIMMGLFFIYWGLSTYFGLKVKINLPHKISRFIQKNMSFAYQLQQGNGRSFFIGLFTALLPCGLLYSILISLAVFQSPTVAGLGMFFFTLGTIPALILSPAIVRKVLSPLQNHFPKLTSLGLITFGLITITYRIYTSYGQSALNCH